MRRLVGKRKKRVDENKWIELWKRMKESVSGVTRPNA